MNILSRILGAVCLITGAISPIVGVPFDEATWFMVGGAILRWGWAPEYEK